VLKPENSLRHQPFGSNCDESVCSLLPLSINKSAGAPTRLWELRQYNDGPERVPFTVDRFGSGEKEIFTKHGMQTVKFWTATDNSAFIYLLALKDRAASNESWKGFRSEFPEFMKKYRDSHPNLPAGRGNGNEVRFLIPTDYSPRKRAIFTTTLNPIVLLIIIIAFMKGCNCRASHFGDTNVVP